jgi:acylphosphatase
LKHITITVQGKVQGVFFRASTKEKADELGVRGSVRNNVDGSVSISAEGEEEDLKRFAEWCKAGPPQARVDYFDVQEKSWHGFKDFSIQR